MQNNYGENNNNTGYPLNGGIKPIESPEQISRYNELKKAYDELLENYKVLEHRLDEANLEIRLITNQNKGFEALLRLALGGRDYGMDPTQARPVHITRTNEPNFPKDVYGVPVPYCTCDSAKPLPIDEENKR